MSTSGAEPGLLLGLDLGTTWVKAVLVDRAGAVTERAATPTPFVTRSGGAEMDMADLEGSVTGALSQLGAGGRARIAGIGIAGMAESGVPLLGGHPAAPLIAWFDGRGEQAVARLQAAFGDHLSLRIGQRLRAVSSVAKLGWLLKHELYRKPPERWLGVPETVLFLLTGAEATEFSLAARTGAYDIAERAWMPEVIEALGLPPAVFPPVRPAGAVMGRVTEAAAVRGGVPAGVPVTVAGHDHLAAVESLEPVPDDLFNSVGTAETLVRHQAGLPDLERALGLGLAVTVRPGGDGWAVLASATRSGMVLDALAAELGHSHEELDRLAEEAEGVPPVPAGDEVTPGQHAEAAPGEVWAWTLSALTARMVAAADRSSALLGDPSRVVVFGGGSRGRLWLQAKARSFPPGVEVLVATEPEATARGAALAGGVAAGWWDALSGGPPATIRPVGDRS